MTEQELAIEIGISGDELARLRERYLLPGTHFEKKGRVVRYTAAGEAELRGMLNLGAPAKKNGLEPVTVEKPGVLLRVVKVGLPSGRHVRCSDGLRSDLIVDVRSARNFRVGMELRAVARPGADRVFVFYEKLPRWPGRW